MLETDIQGERKNNLNRGQEGNKMESALKKRLYVGENLYISTN